jgi:O-6-methylguanine DNA methyltransferase
MVTDFQKRVFRLAEKIPRGKVSTYRQVAKALGKPSASRAVGNALNKSPGIPKCPCHRVVRSNGQVGGFASGTKKKIKLLESEGVIVSRGRVDLKKYAVAV